MNGKEHTTKGLIWKNYFQIFVKILMMKKILIIVLVSLYCTACTQMNGSGNIVSEDRNIGNFTGIEAGGAFEVELRNGEVVKVRVEADDNLINLIETKVDGNILKITSKSGRRLNNGYFKVFITAPEINYIYMSGAASVIIKDILKNKEKIKLQASGAASIKGELESPEVETEASGAATINISGRTQKYIAESSGSATTKSSQLLSETTTASSSGAANLHVFSSVSLKANASGASEIRYKGGGSTVIKTSGAASCEKKN